MGQLVSPSRSARVLADWFLEEFDNTDQPLQSLSLLVSEQEPSAYTHARATDGSMSPPQATIGNVTKAITDWVVRASTNPDNMVILFFAGHGISSTADSLLFLQDFGAQPLNKYAGAINLNDFIIGMRTMVPSKQLFLIDACRSSERIQPGTEGARKGDGIVAPADMEGRVMAEQSVHHSTAEFSGAYGEFGGVSFFTDALLKALRGGAAQPHIQWHVGTSGIEVALAAYVSRASARYGILQIPERSRGQFFKVCKPKGPIFVPLYISLDIVPAWNQLEDMEARCAAGVSASWENDAQNATLEWSCTIPLREHQVAAKFRYGAVYSHAAEVVMPAPPEAAYMLTIQEAAP